MGEIVRFVSAEACWLRMFELPDLQTEQCLRFNKPRVIEAEQYRAKGWHDRANIWLCRFPERFSATAKPAFTAVCSASPSARFT
jgi:hypothetical protein